MPIYFNSRLRLSLCSSTRDEQIEHTSTWNGTQISIYAQLPPKCINASCKNRKPKKKCTNKITTHLNQIKIETRVRVERSKKYIYLSSNKNHERERIKKKKTKPACPAPHLAWLAIELNQKTSTKKYETDTKHCKYGSTSRRSTARRRSPPEDSTRQLSPGKKKNTRQPKKVRLQKAKSILKIQVSAIWSSQVWVT